MPVGALLAGVGGGKETLSLGRDDILRLTLFGSSPLQLALEPTFLSVDIDHFPQEWDDKEVVEQAVADAGLRKGEADLYVQVCVETNFRSSPRWRDRIFVTQVGSVTLALPHPIDILIAKLHRLEEKDMRAFRMVIEKTGHPTEDEMRRELQMAVDLFRPNLDEEMAGDIITNTRVLWQELWGKEINVRQEIIAPALARIREGYAPDLPRHDYKADLRRLGEEPPA